MTEEEMEGPISFWEYKEQESHLILPEHDDDDDDDDDVSPYEIRVTHHIVVSFPYAVLFS